MKATGIVRRIDDLGRVVIPKEIRRTMRIREGDPLEIYIDRDGECDMICIVKYNTTVDIRESVDSMIGHIKDDTFLGCKLKVLSLMTEVTRLLEEEEVNNLS